MSRGAFLKNFYGFRFVAWIVFCFEIGDFYLASLSRVLFLLRFEECHGGSYSLASLLSGNFVYLLVNI